MKKHTYLICKLKIKNLFQLKSSLKKERRIFLVYLQLIINKIVFKKKTSTNSSVVVFFNLANKHQQQIVFRFRA